MSRKESERIKQFALSHLGDSTSLDTVSLDVIRAICEKHLATGVGKHDSNILSPGLTLVESLAHQSTAHPESFQEKKLDGSPSIPPFAKDELRQMQISDSAINAVVGPVETGENPPPSLRAQLPDFPLLLRELGRLEMRNGAL